MMVTPETDLQDRINRALLDQELRVTTRDTDALAGKIGTINTKLTYVFVGLGIILSVLLSTYGSIAWFTWRLVSELLASSAVPAG